MNDLSTDTGAAPQGEALTEAPEGATPISNQAPAKTPEQLAAEAKPEPKAKAEPKTARDAVKDAMDKVLKEPEAKDAKLEKDAKPEAKPAAEKPEAKADAKPEGEEGKEQNAAPPKAGETAGREGEDGAPSEGKHVNAPARLLPKARDVWVNTPRAVQDEFHRMEREYATEIEAHREAKAFADEVQQYRDMAKQAGTTVKSALDRYVDFDRKIHQDFGAGIKAIADDQGRGAIEVVTGILRAYGVTPAQFAEAVTKNPQAFAAQQNGAPRPPQQPRVDPLAQKALQEVQSLKQQLQMQSLEQQVIAPFAAKHPRYDELQEPIAKILQSGMVPQSLSMAERLEVAYDMAERLNPSPVVAQPAAASPDRTAPSDAGKKSISGAPGNGTSLKGKPKVMSIKESIAAAMRGV